MTDQDIIDYSETNKKNDLSQSFKDKELHKCALSGFIGSAIDIDKYLFTLSILGIGFFTNYLLNKTGNLDHILSILIISTIGLFLFTAVLTMIIFNKNKKYFKSILYDNCEKPKHEEPDPDMPMHPARRVISDSHQPHSRVIGQEQEIEEDRSHTQDNGQLDHGRYDHMGVRRVSEENDRHEQPERNLEDQPGERDDTGSRDETDTRLA